MSILAAVTLLAPSALAYGTLDAVNDVEPTLRSVVLPQRAGLYQVMQAPPGEEPRLRIDFQDGTWILYLDEGRRNNRRDAEDATLFELDFPEAHGNVTDHVAFVLPAGFAFSLCVERAQEGLANGAGLGLRCGGDVDGDEEGDLSELLGGRNPLGEG